MQINIFWKISETTESLIYNTGVNKENPLTAKKAESVNKEMSKAYKKGEIIRWVQVGGDMRWFLSSPEDYTKNGTEWSSLRRGVHRGKKPNCCHVRARCSCWTTNVTKVLFVHKITLLVQSKLFWNVQKLMNIFCINRNYVNFACWMCR